MPLARTRRCYFGLGWNGPASSNLTTKMSIEKQAYLFFCVAWLVNSCAYQPLNQIICHPNLHDNTYSAPRWKSSTAILRGINISKTLFVATSSCPWVNVYISNAVVDSESCNILSLIRQLGPFQQDCFTSVVQTFLQRKREGFSFSTPYCNTSNIMVDSIHRGLRGGGHAIFRSRDDRCIPVSTVAESR